MPEKFVKTEIQHKACALMAAHEDIFLVGGSRSSKTTAIIYNIVIRAMKCPSRHLVVRKAFNHVKASIWHDTFPKVMAGFFPGVKYHENKQDWFITIQVPEQFGGGTSQIWFGGIDDKDRVEKILGNEYSTVFANEVSQISYDAITMLRTRLAENSGLTLRFYYDANPPSKSHWSYQEFVKKLIPGTKEPSLLDSAYMFMNPRDNIANLPARYIKILEALPKRQRQRFLDGLFTDDVEGTLWDDQMISDACTRDFGELVKIVVAVDPAVTNNKTSDEVGIVVCGLDEFGIGVVLEDATGKMSTKTWARRVINLYDKWDANEVVAEVNQGGDLVDDVLKNECESVKVVKVRASKGKLARAEPVSQLYELGRVAHVKGLDDLEEQLTTYIPLDAKYSPGRLDGVVWGLTRLMIRKSKKINVA